jgi:hypothetical protein
MPCVWDTWYGVAFDSGRYQEYEFCEESGHFAHDSELLRHPGQLADFAPPFLVIFNHDSSRSYCTTLRKTIMKQAIWKNAP